MDGSVPPHVSDRVRAACAWVSSRAGGARIDEERIDAYAAELPSLATPDPETELREGDREARAALWHRGGGARYNALPRPRCRCTAY